MKVQGIHDVSIRPGCCYVVTFREGAVMPDGLLYGAVCAKVMKICSGWLYIGRLIIRISDVLSFFSVTDGDIESIYSATNRKIFVDMPAENEECSSAHESHVIKIDAVKFACSRTQRILKANGFVTVGDLTEITELELKRLKGVGDRIIVDIKAQLKKFGVRLANVK